MAPPRPHLGVPCCRRCNARNHTPDTTVYPRSKGMPTLISWAGIQGEKAGTAQGRLEVRSTWRTLWAQRRIRNCECCRKPQLRLWVGWGQGGGAIWGTVEVGLLFWQPSLADEDQCRTVEQETCPQPRLQPLRSHLPCPQPRLQPLRSHLPCPQPRLQPLRSHSKRRHILALHLATHRWLPHSRDCSHGPTALSFAGSIHANTDNATHAGSIRTATATSGSAATAVRRGSCGLEPLREPNPVYSAQEVIMARISASIVSCGNDSHNPAWRTQIPVN